MFDFDAKFLVKHFFMVQILSNNFDISRQGHIWPPTKDEDLWGTQLYNKRFKSFFGIFFEILDYLVQKNAFIFMCILIKSGIIVFIKFLMRN